MPEANLMTPPPLAPPYKGGEFMAFFSTIVPT
jgi:hypothetical protein